MSATPQVRQGRLRYRILLVTAFGLLLLGLWWERAGPVAHATPTSPSPAAQAGSGAGMAKRPQPPGLASAGPVPAEAPVAAPRPAGLQVPLLTTAPQWLRQASLLAPCSTAPEPPEVQRSIEEDIKAQQALLASLGKPLQASPDTDLRAAGLYLQGRVEDLVQEAHSGQSALVMEWAWLACQSHEGAARPSACNSLEAQQLLDRGVGDPHSLLLSQLEVAVAQRDALRADRVLEAMAATRPGPQALDRLPAMVAAVWPDDMPNTQRMVTLSQASLVAMMGRTKGVRNAVELCHPELLADKTGRRASCEGLARRLTQDGLSYIEVAIGLSLGHRLGWPLAEVQAQRLALDAGQQAHQDVFFSHFGRDGRSLDACGVVTTERQRAWAWAQQGERWFFEQHLQQSGRDMAAWAQRVKAYQPMPAGPAPSAPL